MKTQLTKILVLTIVIAMLAACGSNGSGSSSSSGGASGDKEVTTWSFYSAYGVNDAACCEVTVRLFNEIEEKTDGRLKINTYWSGMHPYDDYDMLKALSDGSAEIVYFLSGYLSAVEPIFAVDSMPLMIPTAPMAAWAIISDMWGDYTGDKNSSILERLLQENWGATMVHNMPASPQRIFTRGFDVPDMYSLKGAKIRTYNPELAKFVEIMGGTPVPIAFAEVYTSLATNLIDGLITSTAFGHSGGIFDYCDVINMWEISQSTDGMVASLDALAALPDDVREIFLSVMRESALKPEMLDHDLNEEVVKVLKSEGVKVVTPNFDDWSAVREVCKEQIWDAWLERVGPNGQLLLDQIDRKLAEMSL